MDESGTFSEIFFPWLWLLSPSSLLLAVTALASPSGPCSTAVKNLRGRNSSASDVQNTRFPRRQMDRCLCIARVGENRHVRDVWRNFQRSFAASAYRDKPSQAAGEASTSADTGGQGANARQTRARMQLHAGRPMKRHMVWQRKEKTKKQ